MIGNHHKGLILPMAKKQFNRQLNKSILMDLKNLDQIVV